MSQLKFADKCGISQTTYSHYETGLNLITTMNAYAICKTYNISLDYLKNIYEDKVNGVITFKQFKSLMVSYTKEEKIYLDQIKSIINEINNYKMKEESLKNNNDLFSKYQKLEELNRIIIQEFIDKIYIGKVESQPKSRSIYIKWNFK